MSSRLTTHTHAKRPARSVDHWSDVDESQEPARASPRPSFPFKAELDMAELDERGRPGAAWSGRACELSRGHIVVNSRKMCYEGREAIVAVHLVDDRPVPLFGKVTKSEYDGDGLYKTVLELAPLPQTDAIQAWIAKLSTRA